VCTSPFQTEPADFLQRPARRPRASKAGAGKFSRPAAITFWLAGWLAGWASHEACWPGRSVRQLTSPHRSNQGVYDPREPVLEWHQDAVSPFSNSIGFEPNLMDIRKLTGCIGLPPGADPLAARPPAWCHRSRPYAGRSGRIRGLRAPLLLLQLLDELGPTHEGRSFEALGIAVNARDLRTAI
jgi:hypothetical protein